VLAAGNEPDFRGLKIFHGAKLIHTSIRGPSALL
jgi:hypothetical protein